MKAVGMNAVDLTSGRVTLRDFTPTDRDAFTAYQMDPRYRALYDLDDDPSHAEKLFALFATWQTEMPRYNLQVGIFDLETDRLCGCGGLRRRLEEPNTAVLGIELAPSEWGRYRIALDAASGLVEYGFNTLGLSTIVGDTSSGNTRVEKLAKWFGAEINDRREGPDWMKARGWQEVDWALDRQNWIDARRR